MFRRKANIETVPVAEYTDFSERLKGSEYATKKTVITACIPLAVAIPIVSHRLLSADTYTATSIPVATVVQPPPPIPAPQTAIDIIAQTPATIPVNVPSPEFIQTGVIADTSLEAIANVMEPLINILVAVSFPVASVIMVGACFFFMFGNSEKAWSMIMNAGLGYVLIQMSPLFLNMLRTVGEAV